MENKCVYHQMMEKSKVISSDKFSLKDLQKLLEVRYIQRVERNKELKESMKHLNNRAKELGKAIPTELIAYTMRGGLVGSWFFEKYAEWL